MSTGKLYTEVGPGSAFKRSDFENLLRSLTSAGLIALTEHPFEKDEQDHSLQEGGTHGERPRFGTGGDSSPCDHRSAGLSKGKRKISSPPKGLIPAR